MVSSLKVSIWTKQYTATAHRDIPAMNELSDWLTNNLPENDDEVTLAHGDFRLDNLIFHPTEVQLPRADFLPQCCNFLAINSRCLVCFKGPRNCSVGLGVVYHRKPAGRSRLLPHASILAHKFPHDQNSWLLTGNRR